LTLKARSGYGRQSIMAPIESSFVTLLAVAGGGWGCGGWCGNPINNGLYAAEKVQRQARDAARRQQDQAPRGH
jgi:hypothetical protein